MPRITRPLAPGQRVGVPTHGMARSVEYRTWWRMKTRCENPNSTSYKNYGGRGIRVCDRWQSFENFYADLGDRPSPKHSLDRYPDNDGDYKPGNCRWATKSEQFENRRPYKKRSHCRNGHEFTPKNTYLVPKGGRSCRTCRRLTHLRLRSKERPQP